MPNDAAAAHNPIPTPPAAPATNDESSSGRRKDKSGDGANIDGSWFASPVPLGLSLLMNLLLLGGVYLLWSGAGPLRLPAEEDLSGSFVADGLEADEIAIGKFRASRIEGGKITLKFGPGSLVVEQSGEEDELTTHQSHDGGAAPDEDSGQPDSTEAAAEAPAPPRAKAGSATGPEGEARPADAEP